MSIDNARVPDIEDVKRRARSLLTEMHSDMLIEMELALESNSDDAVKADKAVYTVIDGYQTACVTMVSYLNDIRRRTGLDAKAVPVSDMTGLIPQQDSKETTN